MAVPTDVPRAEPFSLTPVDRDLRWRIVRRLGRIRLRGVVQAWPFAVLSACLARGGFPSAREWFLLLTALLSARAFVIAFSNALVAADAEPDAPPSQPWQQYVDRFGWWAIAFSAGVVVLTACGFLNRPALGLAPFGLACLLACWYVRGLRWYCHFAVGLSAGLAPAAAWVAVRASLVEPGDWPAWALAGGVALWAAGMDMLQSCPKQRHDRELGLETMAARYGPVEAMRMSRMCHALAALSLLIVACHAPMGPIYVAGAAGVAALLLHQHALVRPNDFHKMDTQFYMTNALVGLLLMGAGVVDLFVA